MLRHRPGKAKMENTTKNKPTATLVDGLSSYKCHCQKDQYGLCSWQHWEQLGPTGGIQELQSSA